MPPKGARLTCGVVTICILPEGKSCYPECILVQEGLPCPLIDGVRYASVEAGGTLCQGISSSLSRKGLHKPLYLPMRDEKTVTGNQLVCRVNAPSRV